jgi:tryptophan-rich sensory protein
MFIIFVPLLLSFFSSFFSCGFDNTVHKPKFQPPGWVFGVVWTLIYLCFGLFLHIIINSKDPQLTPVLILWVINLLINMIWSPLFTCLKEYKIALYLILVLLLTNYLLYTLTDNVYAKCCMVPYIVWLHVALLLNANIIEHNK